jgi:predicted Zn-dependent protease with MMP-like domain
MSQGATPTIRRILLSALAALTVGFAAVSLIDGFSASSPLRLLQGLAVFAAGAVVISGVIALTLVHLAGWKEPESELEFEALVQRSEALAARAREEDPERLRGGGWDDDLEPARGDGHPLDPYDEADFRALVRAAVDELPLEFHRALEHVAIVVDDGGRARRAYGLYEGDTIARDYFHERIVIFRDTLTRDFGERPDLLRAQVTRTVRHELAHHLGWDENGVRGLGL